MVDEKQIVGCAVAVVGVVGLFYANWKLVPVGVVLAILFGICAVVGLLVSTNRFILPIFLTFSTIIARGWVREYPITVENGWRPGLMVLLMLAALTASVGTLLGTLVRQGIDRWS